MFCDARGHVRGFATWTCGEEHESHLDSCPRAFHVTTDDGVTRRRFNRSVGRVYTKTEVNHCRHARHGGGLRASLTRRCARGRNPRRRPCVPLRFGWWATRPSTSVSAADAPRACAHISLLFSLCSLLTLHMHRSAQRLRSRTRRCCRARAPPATSLVMASLLVCAHPPAGGSETSQPRRAPRSPRSTYTQCLPPLALSVSRLRARRSLLLRAAKIVRTSHGPARRRACVRAQIASTTAARSWRSARCTRWTWWCAAPCASAASRRRCWTCRSPRAQTSRKSRTSSLRTTVSQLPASAAPRAARALAVRHAFRPRSVCLLEFSHRACACLVSARPCLTRACTCAAPRGAGAAAGAASASGRPNVVHMSVTARLDKQGRFVCEISAKELGLVRSITVASRAAFEVRALALRVTAVQRACLISRARARARSHLRPTHRWRPPPRSQRASPKPPPPALLRARAGSSRPCAPRRRLPRVSPARALPSRPPLCGSQRRAPRPWQRARTPQDSGP